MKLTQILSSFMLLTSAAKGCTGNNCNRAITGTRENVASRFTDCLSFLSVTVTAVASISTSTTTVYSITGNDAYVSVTVKKRTTTPAPVTVTPTSIPFYASAACQATGPDFTQRYVAACSCGGATAATTTVSVPPSSTVTTTTVTVSSFKILATATALSPSTQFMFPEESAVSPNYLGISFNAVNPADGSSVWKLSGGYLQTYLGQFAQQDSGAHSEWIWVDTAANIAANGWRYIFFIVDPFTLAVTARGSDTGNSVLQVCVLDGVPFLDLAAVAGTPEQTTGAPCHPVVLKAVPLP